MCDVESAQGLDAVTALYRISNGLWEDHGG
jgi:hypothetical protein